MLNSISAVLLLSLICPSACLSVPHPGHGGPPPPKRPPPISHSSEHVQHTTSSTLAATPVIPTVEPRLLSIPAHVDGQQPLLNGFLTRTKPIEHTSATQSTPAASTSSSSTIPPPSPSPQTPNRHTIQVQEIIIPTLYSTTLAPLSPPTTLSIESQCFDTTTTTVLLGSVTAFDPVTGEPTLDFQPTCRSPPSGLLHMACPALVQQARICLTLHRTLGLAIGAPNQPITFPSRAAAVSAAVTLWDAVKHSSAHHPADHADADTDDDAAHMSMSTSTYLRPLCSVPIAALLVYRDQRPSPYFDVFAGTLRLLARTAGDGDGDRDPNWTTATTGGGTLYRRPLGEKAHEIPDLLPLSLPVERVRDGGRDEGGATAREWVCRLGGRGGWKWCKADSTEL